MDGSDSARSSTVTAVLEDGPLAGRRIETRHVEGRPPKTIEVDGGDGTTWRYALSDWVQAGPLARYSCLYRV